MDRGNPDEKQIPALFSRSIANVHARAGHPR